MNYPGFKITIEPIAAGVTVEAHGTIIPGAISSANLNRLAEGRSVTIIPQRASSVGNSSNLLTFVKMLSLLKQGTDTSGLVTAIDALNP